MIDMLQKFKVKNYRCFRDELVWDFTNVKNYEFNEQFVRNGILKNAIVYGKNASGKTNLGRAILDVLCHLTDSKWDTRMNRYYKNLQSNEKIVSFEYVFNFDGSILTYYYEKEEAEIPLREKMSVNGQEIISAETGFRAKVNLKGAEQLNLDMWDGSISFVKYVAKNTVLDKNDAVNATFLNFMKFVEHMLLFSSTDGNKYIGRSDMRGSIGARIADLDAVTEFQDFLLDMGIDVQLTVRDYGEEKNIYCIYKNNVVLFQDVWSSGTRSLAFLFLWYIQMKEMSFVVIDEFDAFYHYELAESVVRRLIALDTQIIFTSHNTDLITNDLLRPDCYFELRDNKIKSLADRTTKALRQAHNLQKMYKAGAFDEK